jgi:hypothetical protein
MGAEAGGVALVAHIADEEVFVCMLPVKLGLEVAVLHHAGAEAVTEEDDAGVFFEGEGGRARAVDSEKAEDEDRAEARHSFHT